MQRDVALIACLHNFTTTGFFSCHNYFQAKLHQKWTHTKSPLIMNTLFPFFLVVHYFTNHHNWTILSFVLTSQPQTWLPSNSFYLLDFLFFIETPHRSSPLKLLSHKIFFFFRSHRSASSNQMLDIKLQTKNNEQNNNMSRLSKNRRRKTKIL